ncbi:MAG TPA: aminotransferase class V-fold PLP-dependent enzyme [Cyclobacteriaceae bacterium]|jgi:selenocysteine lyase/cysteine desulfurase|nr:aminotransferase class V-fold PLP-dependent enzyme [Cyclobacteriaceae bacterium]
MILENQKSIFSIPSDITFLNCSYMSPMLNSVKEAAMFGLEKRGNPWKFKTDDWFGPAEEVRGLFAKIINTGKENVALAPSVSYGIATAAKNIHLTPKQKIILLDQQYPSNVYSWRELSKESGAEIITIKRGAEQTWTEAILEKINEQTGLVAIPNCHWTDGSLIDLVIVSAAVKKVKAKLVIDASQSVGAYPIDVSKIKPDFLVSVGYKWLLGPYGLGYLYMDPQYATSGIPIEYGWLNKKGSEDFSKLVEYQDQYEPGARRFDAGGFPSFIHLPMAIAGMKQLLSWGIDNVQESISTVTDAIEIKAKEFGLKVPEKRTRVGHMIGVTYPLAKVAMLSKRLAEHQVFVSFRGDKIRVAPHLYNDKNDVDRLFEVLKD